MRRPTGLIGLSTTQMSRVGRTLSLKKRITSKAKNLPKERAGARARILGLGHHIKQQIDVQPKALVSRNYGFKGL